MATSSWSTAASATALRCTASWFGPPVYRGGSLLEPADTAFTEDGPWCAVYGHGRRLVVDRVRGSRQLFAASDVKDQHPFDAGGL